MSEKRQRNSHVWERGDNDWYVEPERVTHQLCAVEKFVGRIFDPCCGGGNIVKALIAEGYEATGCDIVDRAGSPPWFIGTADFLESYVGTCDNIVMNPPFFRGKGTESFIRKALSITRGKVCAFTEARFLFGSKRAQKFYAELPPTRVYLVTPRPSCPTGAFLARGGEAKGGQPDFCWLVYDKTVPFGGTKLGWVKAEAGR